MNNEQNESQRSTLTVGPAEEADLPVISDLAKRTWADAFGNSLSSEDAEAELESKRSIEYFRNAMKRDSILVARRGADIVGYVQFGNVDIPEVGVDAGDQELHRVYVETALQGQGIGRQLIDAALMHPRLRDARRVFLQVWDKNENAINLHKTLGFRVVGTTQFTIGTRELAEDLVMVLDKSSTAHSVVEWPTKYCIIKGSARPLPRPGNSPSTTTPTRETPWVLV